MINIYPANSVEWIGMGRILTPSSCTVHEIAGGEYELTLTHPVDEDGRWLTIKLHNLIKAPVPRIDIPKIAVSVPTTGGGRAEVYYTTNKDTKAYSLPSNKVRGTSIPKGTRCAWAYGDSNGFVFVSTPYASIGRAWINKKDVDRSEVAITPDTTGTETFEMGMHQTAPQVFRIYEVNVDSKSMTVTAKARHIFYDWMYAVLKVGNFPKEQGWTVESVVNSVINGRGTDGLPSGYEGGFDDMLAATNIIGVPFDGDLSWQNPVKLITDPDRGLVTRARAQLIRDNTFIYLLQNNAPDRGYSIRYAKNMRSVYWSENADKAVTDILPVGQADHGYFALPPDGEAFGFSRTYSVPPELASRYPFRRIEVLKVSDAKTNDINGWRAMQAAAYRRINDESCGMVKPSVRVDFVELENTEEFADYRGLSKLYLYDTVHIIHAPLGIKTVMQVREYEWDAILQRYNSITLGDIFDTGTRTLPIWGLKDGSIMSDKLDYGSVSDMIRRVMT